MLAGKTPLMPGFSFWPPTSRRWLERASSRRHEAVWFLESDPRHAYAKSKEEALSPKSWAYTSTTGASGWAIFGSGVDDEVMAQAKLPDYFAAGIVAAWIGAVAGMMFSKDS